MASKRVAIILYGADRELWNGSGAKLIVRDLNVESRRILARAELEHPTIDVMLQDLAFDAGQAYGLTIQAKGHRTVSQLIRRSTFLVQDGDRRVERPDRIFRLMIVPTHPSSHDLDEGFERLSQRGSLLTRFYSEDEYENLEPAQQMALLNIEAKLRATYVGQDSVLSYVRGIRAVESDRMFLYVESRLKDAVDQSADFASATGHPAPAKYPEFPACPDSWKHTRYEFGNVQLSFSEDTEVVGVPPVVCHSIDADIDLARGIGHVAEWLDNNVLRKGQKTDQTMIYALLFAQGILPEYTLSQAE